MHESRRRVVNEKGKGVVTAKGASRMGWGCLETIGKEGESGS